MQERIDMKDKNGVYRRLTQEEKDSRRTRNIQYLMRMRGWEKATIEENMKAGGYRNMNDYLIDMGINGYIMVPQGRYIKPINDCAYELNKIGVNINQIAHRVNSTDVFNDYDFASLKVKLDEAVRIIREAYDYFLT